MRLLAPAARRELGTRHYTVLAGNLRAIFREDGELIEAFFKAAKEIREAGNIAASRALVENTS